MKHEKCLPIRIRSSRSRYITTGKRVERVLDDLATKRGLPKIITCDNGTEFTSKALKAWAIRHDVGLNFSEPGKPTKNAFVESSNGRMQDEFLNQNIFFGLHDARHSAEQWRQFYNEERPHSAMGRIPPATFALTHQRQHVQQVAGSLRS